MATKSPEATIDFLLMCLECTEGKTDWEKVALQTGWYKGGKFSRQAFVGIQKKYAGKQIGAGAVVAGTTKPTKIHGKITKKRPLADATAAAGEDDADDDTAAAAKKKVKKESNGNAKVKSEDEKASAEGEYGSSGTCSEEIA